jgi:hypothetical protein
MPCGRILAISTYSSLQTGARALNRSKQKGLLIFLNIVQYEKTTETMQ